MQTTKPTVMSIALPVRVLTASETSKVKVSRFNSWSLAMLARCKVVENSLLDGVDKAVDLELLDEIPGVLGDFVVVAVLVVAARVLAVRVLVAGHD